MRVTSSNIILACPCDGATHRYSAPWYAGKCAPLKFHHEWLKDLPDLVQASVMVMRAGLSRMAR